MTFNSITSNPLHSMINFLTCCCHRQAQRAANGEHHWPFQVVLPDNTQKLDEALFPLHRQIEHEYVPLPWPEKIQNIVVFTEVKGGRGDIAAAAKAIGLMQRIGPSLNFDWVLEVAHLDQYDPKSFLNCEDSSKVEIRKPSKGVEQPGDFLLVGPIRFFRRRDYVENSCIEREVHGPLFGFMENAERLETFYSDLPRMLVLVLTKEDASREVYTSLHNNIFPSSFRKKKRLLPMGLQSGSGVFLDRSRMEAPLSRGYYCPSYLQQIEDLKLRQDILEAMGNEEQSSFNSGYAHHDASWEKFIRCVAIHEHNRNVVIVLNQKGAWDSFTTEEFGMRIITPELLFFLKQRGYGEIRVKGQGNEEVFVQQTESESERRLTVIIRPSFTPADMKWMQLASERLLATGDNSAAEAWCARCKLYLYEDVGPGCKNRFLQQQVDLAQTISPNLARLLALFGGDRRVEDGCLNKPLSPEKMAEIEALLNDPDLGDATLQFCYKITENYSFEEVLEGALKRCAWTHCLPELNEVEADALNPEFKKGLIDYIRNPETAEKTLQVTTLPELGERVRAVVQRSLCL